MWPTDVPAKPTRMNAPIIADVTAATGTPTAIASPALAAVGGVPRAAEVRPAPSSASAGRLKSASINPSVGLCADQGGVNWRRHYRRDHLERAEDDACRQGAATGRADGHEAASCRVRPPIRVPRAHRSGLGRFHASSLAGPKAHWLPDDWGRRVPYDAAVSATSNASLRVERTGPGGVVARVTLARPEVHNAFDASLIAELRTAFTLLAREGPTELRAVVLAGDGPSFCAGADLAWMRAAIALDTEGNEQDAMAMADMFETIDTCPVPVIARVHGAALGGGMGLCAVADVVIAESGTRFGFTETRLGILPSVISPFVIAKIGESHARALFPGGRRFDATRAARIGLVHEIVEGDDALDAAVEAAVADLLAAGPTAARAAKAIVREVRGLGHGSAKWHTARVIARQRTSDEAQEGFRAFTEKRRPAWTPDQ